MRNTETQAVCKIRTCSEPANWRVATSGHPNGDIDAHYCAQHLFVPAWDESPRAYKVEISGPLNVGGGTDA